MLSDIVKFFLSQWCLENQGKSFFNPKTHSSNHSFYSKHLDNLINPFMSSTNLKNHPKTQNQPKIKNLTELKYVFLGNFKVKTHCELPSSNRTIWHLYRHFLAKIGANKILSLISDFIDFLSPLSNKEPKKKWSLWPKLILPLNFRNRMDSVFIIWKV